MDNEKISFTFAYPAYLDRLVVWSLDAHFAANHGVFPYAQGPSARLEPWVCLFQFGALYYSSSRYVILGRDRQMAL